MGTIASQDFDSGDGPLPDAPGSDVGLDPMMPYCVQSRRIPCPTVPTGLDVCASPATGRACAAALQAPSAGKFIVYNAASPHLTAPMPPVGQFREFACTTSVSGGTCTAIAQGPVSSPPPDSCPAATDDMDGVLISCAPPPVPTGLDVCASPATGRACAAALQAPSAGKFIVYNANSPHLMAPLPPVGQFREFACNTSVSGGTCTAIAQGSVSSPPPEPCPAATDDMDGVLMSCAVPPAPAWLDVCASPTTGRACAAALQAPSDGKFIMYNANSAHLASPFPPVGQFREFACTGGTCTGLQQGSVLSPPADSCPAATDDTDGMLVPCPVVPAPAWLDVCASPATGNACAAALKATAGGKFIMYNLGNDMMSPPAPPKGQFREFACTSLGSGVTCLGIQRGPASGPLPDSCPSAPAGPDGILLPCQAPPPVPPVPAWLDVCASPATGDACAAALRPPSGGKFVMYNRNSDFLTPPAPRKGQYREYVCTSLGSGMTCTILQQGPVSGRVSDSCPVAGADGQLVSCV